MKNAKKLSANKQRLVEWLALTKFNRVPATQEAFAAEIGVSPITVSRWKNDPMVQDELKRRVRQELASERGNFYGALIREATKGSIQHIKLALEILGDIGSSQPQWKVEIVNLVQQNVITLEQVKEEFGNDLVDELFNATVTASG